MNMEKVSRIVIAKSIAAMLNASGGSLLIGYKEGKLGDQAKSSVLSGNMIS